MCYLNLVKKYKKMKFEVCIHFNVNHTHARIHMYVLILKFVLVFFTAMKLRVTGMINMGSRLPFCGKILQLLALVLAFSA